MTAEERMAYFQGEMKRSPVDRTENKRKKIDVIFLKIKFMIAVLLFIVFLSLDYTGYKIKGVGSEDIIKEVTTDFELPKEINFLHNK